MLIGRWLGPGGSDGHGYAVFAEVVDGWDVVEKVMKEPSRKEGSITVLSEKLIIKKAQIVTKDSSELIGYDNFSCYNATRG